ncbi:hypothetical protein SERLADRAFT_386883 [Serpula lacrymans var. lacrymans S7.9]|uniref:Uncharacterized protein n=1 Tax=Serpula lacrymans var. lacrymans (strain S7.9) TaxID=578457 RepID=F8NUU4_SERL9|nr:uncharacterized protein SERLADRAFT_386883 [Serpula lacrymans var. lacrymans S7.9]EGO25260.1 hypothetical protein SERLADRAFT_386883 [Serpula lacrymans var. lacrymans S7.9]
MQPDQYQSYTSPGASSHAHAAPSSAARHVTQPQQPASFYGASVASAVQSAAGNQPQRNPFSANEAPQQGQVNTKEARRVSGMDVWSR